MNIGVISETRSYYLVVKLFDKLICALFFQLQEYQVLEDKLHIITRKYRDIAFDHTQEEETHVHIIPYVVNKTIYLEDPHPTTLNYLDILLIVVASSI